MHRPTPFSCGAPHRRCSLARSASSRTHGARVPPRVATATAAAATVTGPSAMSLAEAMALAGKAKELKENLAGLKADAVEPQRVSGDTGERVALLAARDIKEGQAIVVIPESLAITSIDAEKHELVGPVAEGCSELTALTLWLLAERAKGPASQFAAMLSTLPESTLSPLLWTDAELDELLRGSPVLDEARQRQAAVRQQWQQLLAKMDPARFNPSVFNESAFLNAFSVVVACASYLPSAECFALLPLASMMGRTGNSNGCNMDFDAEQQAVVVTAGRPYRSGQELLLNDGRPNSELLLSTGMLQDNNQSDFINFNAALVPADRYYVMKAQVLESLGFNPQEAFPVCADRMPIQLLAYLRLSRVADPALLAKVSFEQDVELSQMNEYEILQILMGDCRERLAAYSLSYEEDVKLAQSPSLTPKQRVANKLRLAEKKIINATMDAVRRRLAPIRGIPTKSGGMQDPNSDLREIFDTIESLPKAPVKLLEGFMSWARGDDDPDWGAKGRKPRK